MIDGVAHSIVRGMTPLEIGRMRYPDATPREIGEMPPAVVADHLNRYTMRDLIVGQFLEVLPGKFTFTMGHETKMRKDQESEPAPAADAASPGAPSSHPSTQRS